MLIVNSPVEKSTEILELVSLQWAWGHLSTQSPREIIEVLIQQAKRSKSSTPKTKPHLRLSQNCQGRVLRLSRLTIHAKVTDAQTGIRSVKVEGQEVSLGPEGEISHPVQLREGANTFRITAADKEGNENAEEITLHRTPAPPEIKLMFPAPNADNKNSFTIQEDDG